MIDYLIYFIFYLTFIGIHSYIIVKIFKIGYSYGSESLRQPVVDADKVAEIDIEEGDAILG